MFAGVRLRAFILSAAFILDLIIGDPGWWPHPVVYIGKLIKAVEDGLFHVFSLNPGPDEDKGRKKIVKATRESLEDVIILGEVEKIGKKAFKGCNIKELLLPKSLIEIDDNAFNSNKFLRTISIPENVKRIGKSSFAFCPLRNVYIRCWS